MHPHYVPHWPEKYTDNQGTRVTDNKLRILIVEDDYFVKAEIKRALEKLGHTLVGEASIGKVGIDKTIELSPDAILMDIGMSVIDGIEAASIIQNRKPTPIVFLTAHESDDMVELASEAGASAYLTKPPNSAEIDRALIIAMARHKDIMALRRVNKDLEQKTAELQAALDEIKVLQGIIPICAKCKKIKDDEGYWNNLESYIEKHSDAQFSHGICQDCAEELYGDTKWFKKRKEKEES
jgi:DNA-binding NarL/FixJ family response regulator